MGAGAMGLWLRGHMGVWAECQAEKSLGGLTVGPVPERATQWRVKAQRVRLEKLAQEVSFDRREEHHHQTV